MDTWWNHVKFWFFEWSIHDVALSENEVDDIWVNYNISLTWIKAIWGWFPLLNHDSSEVRSEVVIIYPDDIHIPKSSFKKSKTQLLVEAIDIHTYKFGVYSSFRLTHCPRVRRAQKTLCHHFVLVNWWRFIKTLCSKKRAQTGGSSSEINQFYHGDFNQLPQGEPRCELEPAPAGASRHIQHSCLWCVAEKRRREIQEGGCKIDNVDMIYFAYIHNKHISYSIIVDHVLCQMINMLYVYIVFDSIYAYLKHVWIHPCHAKLYGFV